MSLLFPDSESAIVADQPRLHAFVVGVAHYPHLNGGIPGQLALNPLGLGQVTTPRHTALAIANWLLHDYKHADKPLGSMELVLSPSEQVPNSAGVQVGVESATFVNIESAFNRWVARCSTNKDNIAFLYFCGHGLQKVDQFMLPEDFGNPAIANAWRNCINFDAMRSGMRSCKAQTQLFFVDACREAPFGMLDQVNVNGQALISATLGDSVKCSAAYYATTQGKQAFGPANDVTYFGRAIMHCLNGLASTNAKGKWIVTTYSLSKSIGEVMQHYADRYGEPLDCNPDVSGLGVINEPGMAKVIASIGCSSDAANDVAEIELRRSGVSHKAAVNDVKPLIKEVEPGDWEVLVTFPAGQYPVQAPVQCVLMPAVFEGVNVP
jgi:hypothetical protein